MNLSPEQVKAVADWRKKSLGRGSAPLSEIQVILGLEGGGIGGNDYEVDGHFAFPVDESEFDPEYIESELAPERREALIDGAKPTPEEVKRWKEKKESLVFQEDGSWFHFYIWRVDLAEETLYFRSLHGDGGILDDFDGPFLTQEEALAGAANVDISP